LPSILRDREVQFAVALSLETSLISAALALLVGVPVGYFLARTNFTGKTLVDAFLDVPTSISPVALGTLLLISLGTPAGQALQKYLFPIVFSVPGIVLAQFTIAVALTTRLAKAVFDTVDPHYELVARVLGESQWGAFRRVTLPMTRPGIVSAFFLAWARSLGEFGATVTLAGATKFKTETLPTAIYLNLASLQIDKALVLIWILLILSCVVLWAVRRLDRRRSVRT
ncbi:MAG: ABC transporter permease subunit, partial [Thermoleophilia bacterium]|nr:ABC transporter permease subunit [Thermoleophilia bacterium]